MTEIGIAQEVPPTSTAPVAKPVTGQKSWALGFLAWIPIPGVGFLIAAIAMLAVYPATKRKQLPIATENARRAANWALTMLTLIALSFATMITIAVVVPGSNTGGFFPIGYGVFGFGIVVIAHLIITIAGTIVAGKGRVFKNWFSIPYLRAPR